MLATVETSDLKSGTQLAWVRGAGYQERTFMTETGGGRGWDHPKSSTPYLFLQSLKLATSNLAHNLGSRSTLQFLVPYLVLAGWSTGAPQKLCGPRITYPVLCNSNTNVIKLQI